MTKLRVKDSGGRLRKTPSTESMDNVLTMLNPGTELQVIAQEGEWYQAQVTAWIHRSVVDTVADSVGVWKTIAIADTAPMIPISEKLPRPCSGYIYDDFRPAGGHRGIDIAAGVPGPVYAEAGPIVHKIFYCAACGADPNQQDAVGDFSAAMGYGFGNHIVLNYGSFYALYAHLQRIDIPYGMLGKVWTGGPIGIMGKSGNASGWHLHLEVRTDDKFDKSTRTLINPREKFVI